MISSILRCLHYYYHYHYYYNHHYFHHKNPFTEWKEIGVINIDNDNPHFISSDDDDNDIDNGNDKKINIPKLA
jgi:hypothetical protein